MSEQTFRPGDKVRRKQTVYDQNPKANLHDRNLKANVQPGDIGIIDGEPDNPRVRWSNGARYWYGPEWQYWLELIESKPHDWKDCLELE